MRSVCDRKSCSYGLARVVRGEPERHHRAHRRLVVGERQRRRHLRARVVGIDRQRLGPECEQLRCELAEQQPLALVGRGRLRRPEEIHELLHAHPRVAVLCGRYPLTH